MDEKPFSRNNYFSGKLLTAEDLQLEQDYHIRKRRLINRCMYGSGVICGLQVSASPSGNSIVVSPGLALDCLGREIFVPDPITIELPSCVSETYFVIAYSELKSKESPSLDAQTSKYSRIVESFNLAWKESNPLSDHRRLKGRWVCCDKDHGLPLAKFIISKDKLVLDPKFFAYLKASRLEAYCLP